MTNDTYIAERFLAEKQKEINKNLRRVFHLTTVAITVAAITLLADCIYVISYVNKSEGQRKTVSTTPAGRGQRAVAEHGHLQK